jgi:hypothetical protein
MIIDAATDHWDLFCKGLRFTCKFLGDEKMINSFKIALAVVIVFLVWCTDQSSVNAQEVVTYYPPQATVGYVPVQYGLLGRRTQIQPVVSYSPATVTTTYYASPVVEYGQPLPEARSTLYRPVVTTYYAPAPAIYVPAPRYYVAPAVYVAPAPVTAYYISPW